MNQQQQVCVTGLQFANGTIISPTAQWIACILDVLHPEQQTAIFDRIKAIADAQKAQPLITLPGIQESGL